MPKKNYQVFLTENDIAILNKIRKNGHSSVRTIMHANILLNTKGYPSFRCAAWTAPIAAVCAVSV